MTLVLEPIDAHGSHTLPPLPKARTLPLWLTCEEALSLLELFIASIANLGEAEEGILLKLGDLCRTFLREETRAREGLGERILDNIVHRAVSPRLAMLAKESSSRLRASS